MVLHYEWRSIIEISEKFQIDETITTFCGKQLKTENYRIRFEYRIGNVSCTRCIREYIKGEKETDGKAE